jgi:hypothetical protein
MNVLLRENDFIKTVQAFVQRLIHVIIASASIFYCERTGTR